MRKKVGNKNWYLIFQVNSIGCLFQVVYFTGLVFSGLCPSGLNLFRVMSLPGCRSSGLCLSRLCPFWVKSLPGYVSSRLWVFRVVSFRVVTFRVVGIPGCGFPGCVLAPNHPPPLPPSSIFLKSSRHDGMLIFDTMAY